LLIELRVEFVHCPEDGCRRLALSVGRELAKHLVAQIPQVPAQKQVTKFPASLDRPEGAVDALSVCAFRAFDSRPDFQRVPDALLPVFVASFAEQTSIW
jgi:hypothetical protein